MEHATIQIESEEQTRSLGAVLADLLAPGDVVGLCGDLGAGKTLLAGAVTHALGVAPDVPITSPTFTLINEYRGRLPVYHMDLYRLGDPGELYELGLWEYYDGEGVCLVEWCDRFSDLWPARALVLTLGLGPDEQRTVALAGQERGAELAQRLAAAWAALS